MHHLGYKALDLARVTDENFLKAKVCSNNKETQLWCTFLIKKYATFYEEYHARFSLGVPNLYFLRNLLVYEDMKS